MRRFTILCYGLVLLGLQLPAFQAIGGGISDSSSDPEISIVAGEKHRIFKRSELLRSKDLTSVTILEDPVVSSESPQQSDQRIYQAIPFKNLLKDLVIDPKLSIYFHCEDGFSAAIPTRLLLNDQPNQAIPYVAIELPQKKWPILKSLASTKTAGPFYLIWKNAQASQIPREYWPYQLVKFEFKEDPLKRYPHLLPDPQLSEAHRARKGLRAFVTNCFQCHTMNKEGPSQLGPDLNVPMNPTEYLKPKALRMQIRNPEGLRYWPLSKMHGFSPAILSEDELEDVVAYLEHMAKRKVSH